MISAAPPLPHDDDAAFRAVVSQLLAGDTDHSFLTVLRQNVSSDPDKVVFTWLGRDGEVADTLTYVQLWRRAGAVADALVGTHGLRPGDRAMIVYPFGLDFLAGFVGCLRAGVVVCSVYPPDPSRLDRDLPKFLKVRGPEHSRVYVGVGGGK